MPEVKMKSHLFFAACVIILVAFVGGCSDTPPDQDGGQDVSNWDGGGGGDVETDAGTDGGCRKGMDLVCDKCQPKACSQPSNCAPGQDCQGKSCNDTFVQCASDKCTTVGQVCKQDPKGDMSCHFEACGQGGTCPDMYRCFSGYCIIDLPCTGGTCPDKSFCLIDRGNDPTGCIEGQDIWTGCAQTCNIGSILTLKNPDTMSYSTCTTKVECECKVYPDVFLGDFGYFASSFTGTN